MAALPNATILDFESLIYQHYVKEHLCLYTSFILRVTEAALEEDHRYLVLIANLYIYLSDELFDHVFFISHLWISIYHLGNNGKLVKKQTLSIGQSGIVSSKDIHKQSIIL